MNCLGKNQSHEKLSTICAKSKEVLTSNRKTCMNISFIHKATVFHSKLEAQWSCVCAMQYMMAMGKKLTLGSQGFRTVAVLC